MTMRTSIQNIITKYPGVLANLDAGVIVLRKDIDRDNLQYFISELSALHPEKMDNQLGVK